MSVLNKIMAQGGNPVGWLGRVIGILMNRHHVGIYQWGLEHVALENSVAVLDIGCGGGELVKLLAAQTTVRKVYAVDHSLEMVNLSKRVNQAALERDHVEITHGSVSALPYRDAMFDMATAFETIQFWPDLSNDLREVRRVLKPTGRLLIVNRYPDLKGKNSGWGKFLQIHSAQEYRELLTAVGFVDVSIDDGSNPGWIAVSSRKA